jgi:ATP-binding cassette subfamily B protein
MTLQAHRADAALRREHEALAAEWTRAQRSLLTASLTGEYGQRLLSQLSAVGMVLLALPRLVDSTAILLFVFWALQLPSLALDSARVLGRVPTLLNLLLRAVEPLQAPNEDTPTDVQPSLPAAVAVRFEGVTVRAGGHVILDDVHLDVPAGSHVALVGVSGAGKSSLAGVLLGWHRPSAGRVLVDARPLDGDLLPVLRERTAWVDPAVSLWNRSLLDNLRYGAGEGGAMESVIQDARLVEVIQRFPEGLQARLGEGGALVSGGEGQRVRLGRAFGRRDAALVILDEPFRGLGRGERQALLARARQVWAGATLLAITHDLAETRQFARVLVIAGGRIVEDGSPAELEARSGSLYQQMLAAEVEVHDHLWRSPVWRRFHFAGGALSTGEEGE